MSSVRRHVRLLVAVAAATFLGACVLLGSPATAAGPTPTPGADGGVTVDGYGHCHHHHRPCPCPTPTHTMYPIPQPPPGGPIAQPPGSPQLPVTGPDHTVVYAALGGGALAAFGLGLVLVTSRRRRRHTGA